MPKKPERPKKLTDQHVDEFVAGWPENVRWIPWGGVMLPETFWVEWINESDDPDLRVEYRLRDGRVECADLRIHAKDDGREVTPWDGRDVRLDWIRERAVLAASRGVQGADAKTEQSRWPRSFFAADGSEDAALIGELRRSRSRDVTPEKLREVARIYMAHEKAADAVREISKYLVVEPRSVWTWLKRAEDRLDPDTGEPYLSERKRKKETDE